MGRFLHFVQRLGHLFFRIRSYASVPLFAFFFILGRSSLLSFALSLFLITFGEMIRIWAVSFSGPATRTRVIKAPFLAVQGPYEMIRHPIYFGNFFVGLGFTLSLTQDLVHILVFVMFFLIFYGSIIFAEERFLENKFQEKWRRYRDVVPLIIPRSFVKISFGDLKTALKSERSTFITISLILFLASLKLFVLPSINFYSLFFSV